MKGFRWTDQAKSELRQIDREKALEVLHALTHYARTGEGDVKRLKGSQRMHQNPARSNRLVPDR